MIIIPLFNEYHVFLNMLLLQIMSQQMSDRVANWESVVHKTVRSSEGNLIGNVDGVDENSIFVSTEGGRTNYKILKHIVEGYDGREVTLDVQKAELERFKGCWRGFQRSKVTR
jgi:hypothetical protein